MSLAKSWITGNAMVVRPKLKELDLHFLEFFFRGGIDISVAITGTAQPQITRTNLEQIKIRYPQSTTEQAKLVRKFVLLTEETRLLYESYSKKAASLVEFKSSLLSQAFAGELTA